MKTFRDSDGGAGAAQGGAALRERASGGVVCAGVLLWSRGRKTGAAGTLVGQLVWEFPV